MYAVVEEERRRDERMSDDIEGRTSSDLRVGRVDEPDILVFEADTTFGRASSRCCRGYYQLSLFRIFKANVRSSRSCGVRLMIAKCDCRFLFLVTRLCDDDNVSAALSEYYKQRMCRCVLSIEASSPF